MKQLPSNTSTQKTSTRKPSSHPLSRRGYHRVSLVLAATMAMGGLMFPGATFAGGDAAAGKEKSQVCASCHGANGDEPTTPQYPRLAGQYASYLERALLDYKSGKRANAIMAGFSSTLSKDDIRDLAAFYASQSGTLHTPPQSSW